MKVVEEASSRHLVTADVPLSAYPLAVEVRGLRPAVMYKVLFLSAPSSAGQGEASGPRVVGSVSFFTLSSDAAPVHLPVMSCNRVNEDEDVAFAEGISVDQNKRTGAVHLGDQVYADRPVSEARSALERGDGEKASARSAMTRLRNLYRSVFGSASTHAVLSSAPNWMIPDDHDIANNVDADKLVEAVMYDEAVREQRRGGEPALPPIPRIPLSAFAAGRLGAYEYQRLLRTEMPSPSSLLLPFLNAFGSEVNKQEWIAEMEELMADFAHPRTTIVDVNGDGAYKATQSDTFADDDFFFFSRQIGPIFAIFADTRFDRTFHIEAVKEAIERRKRGGQGKEEEDGAIAFFSSTQWEFLHDVIADAKGRDTMVTLFTSLPLPFVPAPIAKVVEWFEQERLPGHEAHREEIGSLMHKLYPLHSRLLLVGGDIHLLLNTTVKVRSDVPSHDGHHPPISAVATSGITRGSSIPVEVHVYVFELLWRAAMTLGSLSLTSTVDFYHDYYFIHNNYLVIDAGGCEEGWTSKKASAQGETAYAYTKWFGSVSVPSSSEAGKPGQKMCMEWTGYMRKDLTKTEMFLIILFDSFPAVSFAVVVAMIAIVTKRKGGAKKQKEE
eukprot:CAMPEP_0113879172 /NCGR_PEP_ID=MMETSP0780_2-20120614/7087_1 /TAXON_ID=652834 /ORGANISM="Palpitomonas bilix" /LENGTH=610 /DNA_ID=CAMNT_0000865717 /DNA_START=562 /DNA_END=2394 /DNA_ORIENTATION=+ /assembly_acc=CAM_ASM_000599